MIWGEGIENIIINAASLIQHLLEFGLKPIIERFFTGYYLRPVLCLRTVSYEQPHYANLRTLAGNL